MFSIWHLLIFAAVITLIFKRGKVSELMGDFGKGMKSFRKELGSAKPRDDKPSLKQD